MSISRKSTIAALAAAVMLSVTGPAMSAADKQAAPAVPFSLPGADFKSAGEWMKSFTDPKWNEMLSAAPSADQLASFLGILSNPKMMQGMLDMSASDPELMKQWMKVATNPALMDALMKLGNPAALDSYLNMLGDPRVMEKMMALNDPELVEPLMKILTNPNFIEGMTKMADPRLVENYMRIMSDPKMFKGVMKMADARTLESYMKAMSDPQFMKMAAKMTDPKVMTGYMKMVTSPEFMESMTRMARTSGDDNVSDAYAEFMKLMLDPQWYSSMMAMMDPAIMQQWMGMMMEPRMLDAFMKMVDPALMVQFMRASMEIMNAAPQAMGVRPPSETKKK